MEISSIVQVATAILTALVGLLVASMRRNVKVADDRNVRIEEAISRVATDVRQLSGTVGSHAERLAAGNEAFTTLKEKVLGLEDRERSRGCFGPCRHPGS